MYRPEGTPTGYLIDERGVIAAQRIEGPAALMAVAKTPVSLLAGFRQDGAAPAGAARVDTAVQPAGDPVRAGEDETAPRREVRLPIPGIAREGIGVGDLVKRMTDAIGLKACRGCERRRRLLNRWVIKGAGGGSSRGGQT